MKNTLKKLLFCLCLGACFVLSSMYAQASVVCFDPNPTCCQDYVEMHCGGDISKISCDNAFQCLPDDCLPAVRRSCINNYGGYCVQFSSATATTADVCTNNTFSCMDNNGQSQNYHCGASVSNPPNNCPNGFIPCATCGCMPNSQTCNYWEANSCGSAGGGNGNGGGGNSCPSGSDCFAGIANCGVVGRQTQTGTCTVGSNPGLCCGFSVSGGNCTVEFQSGPAVMTVGQTATFTAYAAGGIVWWDGVWGWNSGSTPLGTFNPSSHGTGAMYISNFTATTPGFSTIRFRVEEDNGGPLKCEGVKNITVNACVPNCANACGQTDGCGGTCPNTDIGTPATPTIVSPPNNSTVDITASNAINITWAPNPVASLSKSYYIQILPLGEACNSAPGRFCGDVLGTSHVLVVPPNSGLKNWVVKVRAKNGSCSPQTQSLDAVSTFNITGTVSGRFYLDEGQTAALSGTGCTAPPSGGAIPQPPSAGSTITANANGIISNGNIFGVNYSITGVPISLNTVLNFTNGTTGYDCVCPAGCSYSGITSPAANYDFYYATSRPKWWQTRNGLLYAGATSGEAVRSKIPATCVNPGCKPALSLRTAAGTVNSDGFVISAGGSIDSTEESTTQYSYLREGGGTGRIQGATVQAAREDYSYFSQLYSMGAAPSSDVLTGVKPTSAPVNGRSYYSNGNLTVSAPWTVNSGESFVIFVNGNLQVSQPITVTEGGFLAFIVKGNITFDATLAQSQGIYIADGTLTVASTGGNDVQFNGAGSFIGWSGVVMNRQFVPTLANNTTPNTVFTYRPDFMLNIPARMTRPAQIWQETNL